MLLPMFTTNLGKERAGLRWGYGALLSAPAKLTAPGKALRKLELALKEPPKQLRLVVQQFHERFEHAAASC